MSDEEEPKTSRHGGGMTFDEAEKEIASIKQKSKEARQNLEGIRAQADGSGSQTSRRSASDSFSVPKSQNIFSHLTSSDAMLDHQIQNARSLVRKQEELLRHLARMKENLQRSELDIEKCLVSLAPSGAKSRLAESCAESAKVTSRPVALEAGLASGAASESDLDAELAQLRQRISNILDRSESARHSDSYAEVLYVPSMSSSMSSSMCALPSYSASDPYDDYSYSVTYFPDYYSPPRYAPPSSYWPGDLGSSYVYGGSLGRSGYAAALYDSPLESVELARDSSASPFQTRRGDAHAPWVAK